MALKYDIEKFKNILEGRLSKKRYIHSINVADKAQKLAEIWGADEEKAYVAGLLHDICKDIPHTEQRKLIELSNKDVTDEEFVIPQLWHGIAGEVYCRTILGIEDDDILNSIRFHTVARKNMSLLEEIIYLADLTSADREYPDVDYMRKLVKKDIEESMIYALQYSVSDVTKRKSLLPKHTIEAYNGYIYNSKKVRKTDDSE
ncbi:MAG: bis(5'-nucleosyl)-tetraphosphatase (symmetrical) YqeK [Oscillospiraceae bacterium]|nr:bis(5'-nucleosyl)-tetraphosphatase (symmetrical) YqeK [Oscillospiraceae bacterium]